VIVALRQLGDYLQVVESMLAHPRYPVLFVVVTFMVIL
jgi:hypothetical protein